MKSKLTLEEQVQTNTRDIFETNGITSNLLVRVAKLEANKPTIKEAPHQFKVGDEVKVKGLSMAHKDFIGRTAKIREIDKTCTSFPYIIIFDDYIGWFREEDLELVKVDYEAKYNELLAENKDHIHQIKDLQETIKKYETAELKVRDKVEVIEKGSIWTGKVGTIKGIIPNTPFPYYVVFNDYGANVYSAKDLKKVG